jgi:hypothetical protein
MKNFIFAVFWFIAVSPVNAQPSDSLLDVKRRLFIEDFITTYEMAYEEKRIEYIELMFSTNALILTESKELIKNGSEILPRVSKRRPYHTLVEDREMYLKRLKAIFDDGGKVRISISGKKIIRHPKYKDIYGVSFFQLCKSDEDATNIEGDMPGYVFFLVDFNNELMSPIIHVRTWQPKSNIKNDTDKYSLHDFKIYDTR